uniref:Uncharacterized protein n=1 Tax=Arundo donax TaxID=35708 RepID=A0A0A9Q1X2_ARUDO
MVLQPNGRWGA